MKKIVLSLCIFLWSIASVFAALDAPEDLTSIDVSDTSITLDWADTTGAVGYYIYYGTQTASGGVYEEEGVDLIEESTFVLEGLIPETKYYIAITAVDEFVGESEYSQEFEYSTLKVGQKNQANTLRISEVEVVDPTTLEFLFSVNLNAELTAPLEFRIEERSSWLEIGVDIAEVDSTNSKNVIAVLNQALTTNTEYKVTVLDIQDASGKTIASGIDAFLNFTTPANFENPELPLPIVIDPEPQDDPVDLNVAPEVVKPTGNNAGVTISNTSTGTNITLLAQENTALPQTGPTQWFLIIFALLMGGVIYFVNAKKSLFQK